MAGLEVGWLRIGLAHSEQIFKEVCAGQVPCRLMGSPGACFGSLAVTGNPPW